MWISGKKGGDEVGESGVAVEDVGREGEGDEGRGGLKKKVPISFR